MFMARAIIGAPLRAAYLLCVVTQAGGKRRPMAVLELAPDAPAYVKFAADMALILHIGGGSLGIVSGFAALAFRKGSAAHRAAGNIFFVSMLTMSGIGAVVAPMLPVTERISSVAGVLTFYLVATAWMTVMRKEGTIGLLERLAAFVPVGIAIAGVIFLQIAANDPRGTVDGQPPQAIYIFLVIGAIAVLGDVHVIIRRGISGAHRIARHLWRMCFALFVAAASFFLGQPEVFPKEWRGSVWLFVPELMIFAALFFWLARTYFTRAFRSGPIVAYARDTKN